MSGTDLYPRFSEAEFGRRYELVRGLLADAGLDGLVVFGWSALGRAAQADIHYLSNFLGMRDNYVLFPLEGDPTLFVQSFNHVPNAAVVAVIEDVRWGGNDSGATIGEELAHRGLRQIGVVGLMPYQHHASMGAAAADTDFRDVTAEFRRLRVTKSDEEVDWLRRGAAFTDAAMAALEKELRPGLHEYELADIVERAYTRDGGLTSFHYIATTPMQTPDRCVPAQVLSSRVLQAGDVVTTEISAGYGGYAGQALRTFTVASDPTPEIAELHDVAESVYHRVVAAIRPGATQVEVLDAADVIEERGFSIRDGLVHGFGIGILPPSIRTRHTTHGEAPWTFERNQTVVIQPNVITPDERLGVQVGNLCVVGPDGCESLHRYPLRLVTTAG
ncbi:MAG: M24 family metallopeptidase [Nitriliruptorales bacterium]|nr:M24 family metallopeptidase [Nitriliruptorales bacterium]